MKISRAHGDFYANIFYFLIIVFRNIINIRTWFLFYQKIFSLISSHLNIKNPTFISIWCSLYPGAFECEYVIRYLTLAWSICCLIPSRRLITSIVSDYLYFYLIIKILLLILLWNGIILHYIIYYIKVIKSYYDIFIWYYI